MDKLLVLDRILEIILLFVYLFILDIITVQIND